MKFIILQIFTLSLAITSVMAETRYITDEFKVTVRTGTSTSNSILTMLKSGAAVTIIEHDKNKKYTLVETSKGKKGYILTRFLDTQPSGRALYARLQQKSKQQNQLLTSFESKLNTLNQEKNDAESNLNAINQLLTTTSNELSLLKTTTKDTVSILIKNKSQQTLIEQLQLEKSKLLAENNSYKDSTAMDWFIRGAGVSLLAFLIGILVTRIRWKKRASWADF